MKKLLFILFAIFCLTGLTGISAAEERSGSNFEWHGYMQTDNRALTQNEKNEVEYSWQEYRLDLQAEVKPGENSKFYSEMWIRSWSLPNVSKSPDLSQREKVAPIGFDLKEAYLDIYGFFYKNLDIRAGRQRIAWGVGDKINPTDNLNPDDLEDMWDFGRHLGSDSIKASLYLNKFTLTGVFIPVFTPAVLPAGAWAEMLMSSDSDFSALLSSLPPSMTLSISDELQMPAKNPKRSSKTGFKIAASDVLGFDFSASYVYGRDDLPIVQSVRASSDGTNVNLLTTLFYPNMNIFGFDISGSIGNVGVWAEGAAFVPEKVSMTTDLTAINPYIPVTETAVLDNKKPYFKYLAGIDYTFTTGTYINIQYFHGFVHERGRENLEDYFLIGVEQKLFNEKVKITPLAGAIEIKDFYDLKNNYALVYVPEIAFLPVDGAELIIGAHFIDGKSNTTFGKAKKLDDVYLRFKYSF